MTIAKDLLVTPVQDIYPSAKEFWDLIDRGWFIYMDQAGKVLGYIPPQGTSSPIFKTLAETLIELKRVETQ